MSFESELTHLGHQLQSLDVTDRTHEDVQAALKELAPKTRAQAALLQKFLADAGMVDETEETKAGAVATSSSLVSNLRAEESESESEDDTFEKVPPAMNPWAGVSEEESKKAWLAWEVEQEKLVAILKSPQYKLNGPKLKYPNLFKDLMSRLDFEDDETSPRTYEPQMKHWQHFGLLVTVLQEFAKGRETGYLKIKVPAGALSAPPAIQGSAEEVPLTSHRTRLKTVYKNPGFNVDGVYYVEQSYNSFESNALSWRAVLVDVDRDAVRHSGARRRFQQNVTDIITSSLKEANFPPAVNLQRKKCSQRKARNKS
ncbi:MAG: hypothetical protein LQ346_004697 [Caloplaca aetnensis]|nr:MAG: hypothetical protein LQ346_004697 [Caloplaca aetnensis]